MPSFRLIAPNALDCAGSEQRMNSERMSNRMALVRYLSFREYRVDDSFVDFLLVDVFVRVIPF